MTLVAESVASVIFDYEKFAPLLDAALALRWLVPEVWEDVEDTADIKAMKQLWPVWRNTA